MGNEEGFLNRWSRRKLAGEDEAEVPEKEVPEEKDARADGGDEPAQPHPTEDIDIDSLTADSDFTVFMAKGVPAAIKRKALRKLWTTDPALAGLDGLNDYFDLENPKTHGLGPMRKSDWKIGRGFLSEDKLAPPPRRDDDHAPRPREDAVAEAEEKPPEGYEPDAGERPDAPEDIETDIAADEDTSGSRSREA